MSLVAALFLLLAAAQASPRNLSARDTQCGIDGVNRSANPYADFKRIATLKACGAKCTADPQCKSFSYGKEKCYLYKTTVCVLT